MSFLQHRYFNREIELTRSQRRAIYSAARKLWWRRRRNFVIYTAMCGRRLRGLSADSPRCPECGGQRHEMPEDNINRPRGSTGANGG